METIEETAHLNRVREVISLTFSKLSSLDLSAASKSRAQTTIKAVAASVCPYGEQVGVIAGNQVIDCLMWA